MKLLVIGSSGREHAIAKMLQKYPKIGCSYNKVFWDILF